MPVIIIKATIYDYLYQHFINNFRLIIPVLFTFVVDVATASYNSGLYQASNFSAIKFLYLTN